MMEYKSDNLETIIIISRNKMLWTGHSLLYEIIVLLTTDAKTNFSNTDATWLLIDMPLGFLTEAGTILNFILECVFVTDAI